MSHNWRNNMGVNMSNLPSCSCCGVPSHLYESKGHSPECVWYEDEMYRLATEWLNGPEYEKSNRHVCALRADWKTRYNLIVAFLLEEVKCLKNSKIDLSEFNPPPGMTKYTKEGIEEGNKYYKKLLIKHIDANNALSESISEKKEYIYVELVKLKDGLLAKDERITLVTGPNFAEVFGNYWHSVSPKWEKGRHHLGTFGRYFKLYVDPDIPFEEIHIESEAGNAILFVSNFPNCRNDGTGYIIGDVQPDITIDKKEN